MIHESGLNLLVKLLGRKQMNIVPKHPTILLTKNDYALQHYSLFSVLTILLHINVSVTVLMLDLWREEQKRNCNIVSVGPLEILPAWKTPPSGLLSSESAAPRAWMDGLCQLCEVAETALWACQFCWREHYALCCFCCWVVHLRHAFRADLTPDGGTLICLSASVCVWDISISCIFSEHIFNDCLIMQHSRNNGPLALPFLLL